MFAFKRENIYNVFMKKLLPLAISSLLIIPAVGCVQPKPDTSPYFFAMAADAAYVLPASVRNSQENDCYALYGETRELLNALDGSLSLTVSSSYITKFNEAEAGEKVELDATAYEVFSLAAELYAVTEGYYNPAVYYSVCAYGFGGASETPKTEEDLPSDEVIGKYNGLAASFGQVVLSEENGRYYALKPAATVEIDGVSYSMKIDLGGLGKGYAVEKANALMDKHGIKYGYFTFGESSIAFKNYSGEGGEYTLGLTSPRYTTGKPQYVHTQIAGECLSTSGDNVQYYEIGGVRYCHVIDPVTGKPVQTGIMSATVIGASAARNDAYTTAIMAMGKEQAVKFINENLSAEKVFFTYDGGAGYEIITNAPEGAYTVKDDSYKVVSKVVDGKIVLVD